MKIEPSLVELMSNRDLARQSMDKSAQERVDGVRACNSVKFENDQNLPPVLKIVIHTAHAA